MWAEFMEWYTNNYFVQDFDSDTTDYQDHQRACYSAWQAAKRFYTKQFITWQAKLTHCVILNESEEKVTLSNLREPKMSRTYKQNGKSYFRNPKTQNTRAIEESSVLEI